jgi:hypothetical protein
MKKGEMVEGVITNVRYPNKGMMTGKNSAGSRHPGGERPPGGRRDPSGSRRLYV